jgi:hypothetical protein
MSGPRLSVIPAGALADAASGALKPMDLRVLCALGTFTNDSGWARVKQDTLAERAGAARETVNRSIARLVKLGWVEKHAGKHAAASSSYRVKLDVDRPPESDGDVSESENAASAHCDRTVTSRCDDSDHIDCDDSGHNKNESSNESPLTPHSDPSGEAGDRTGSPASDGNGRAAGSPDGAKEADRDGALPKPSRSTGKRRKRAAPPAPPPPPPPAVTLSEIRPELDALPPADRAVLIAALNGYQKPATLRGLIGRFTVTRDEATGTLSLTTFDGGDAVRRYLTGAMEHLGLTVRCWTPDGVERAIGKRRISRPEADPWSVELKPEIEERLNDAA